MTRENSLYDITELVILDHKCPCNAALPRSLTNQDDFPAHSEFSDHPDQIWIFNI